MCINVFMFKCLEINIYIYCLKIYIYIAKKKDNMPLPVITSLELAQW